MMKLRQRNERYHRGLDNDALSSIVGQAFGPPLVGGYSSIGKESKSGGDYGSIEKERRGGGDYSWNDNVASDFSMADGGIQTELGSNEHESMVNLNDAFGDYHRVPESAEGNVQPASAEFHRVPEGAVGNIQPGSASVAVQGLATGLEESMASAGLEGYYSPGDCFTLEGYRYEVADDGYAYPIAACEQSVSMNINTDKEVGVEGGADAEPLAVDETNDTKGFATVLATNSEEEDNLQ
jgi:hypothetical protein